MPIKANTYESELIRLFEALDSKLYGQRGTHSDGVDVLLFKQYGNHLRAWRFEVKSSKADSQSMKDTAKMWGQYQGYLKVLGRFDITTYYAFRSKCSKQRGKDEAEKWRVFRVDRLPMSRNKTPRLDLQGLAGWSIKEFYERVIGRRERRRKEIEAMDAGIRGRR